jgi:hypothetical protein
MYPDTALLLLLSSSSFLYFFFFPVLGLNVQIMNVFSISFLLLPLEKISLSRHQGERSPNKLD